jgi:hypothetical protein
MSDRIERLSNCNSIHCRCSSFSSPMSCSMLIYLSCRGSLCQKISEKPRSCLRLRARLVMSHIGDVSHRQIFISVLVVVLPWPFQLDNLVQIPAPLCTELLRLPYSSRLYLRVGESTLIRPPCGEMFQALIARSIPTTVCCFAAPSSAE